MDSESFSAFLSQLNTKRTMVDQVRLKARILHSTNVQNDDRVRTLALATQANIVAFEKGS